MLRITEIEFYFWSDEHQDNTTHEHEQDAGEWRMHNQGLDITFEALGDNTIGQFGGILIRGIYVAGEGDEKKKHINGPRKVLFKIFELMGKVEAQNILQLVPGHFKTPREIHTTMRHGLKTGVISGYEITDDFIKKPYRYFTDKGKLSYPESHWKGLEINELAL